jgi:glutaredoxin 3
MTPAIPTLDPFGTRSADENHFTNECLSSRTGSRALQSIDNVIWQNTRQRLRCCKVKRLLTTISVTVLALANSATWSHQLGPQSFVGPLPRHRFKSAAVRHAEATSVDSQSDKSFEDVGLTLRLAPLKVASAFMGLLRPIFASQARLSAGNYDSQKVRADLEAEIKSAPVVIYTYALSPFSTEAKALLDKSCADYKEISLGLEWFLASPEAAAKRAELATITGRTSLPQVFINGRSVGGLIDGSPGLVPLLESGKLLSTLKQAGALPDEGLFGFFLYSGEHQKE